MVRAHVGPLVNKNLYDNVKVFFVQSLHEINNQLDQVQKLWDFRIMQKSYILTTVEV